jgi:hypothetical protein
MSEGAKAKKQLEELGKLNAKGASKQEAQTAASNCKALAESPDASLDARAAATAVGRELESPLTQEDAGRREVLTARAVFLATRFS